MKNLVPVLTDAMFELARASGETSGEISGLTVTVGVEDSIAVGVGVEDEGAGVADLLGDGVAVLVTDGVGVAWTSGNSSSIKNSSSAFRREPALFVIHTRLLAVE